MVSLVDIVPQKRVVTIAAGELELRGLGLRQIADLFLQFSALRNVFSEGAPDISIAELIVQAPEAVGAVIAEAAGQPEAAEAITDGRVLTPDEIIDCLEAIRDLTFPRGTLPLLQRAMALVGLVAVAPAGAGPATSAPSPPNGSSPPAMIAAE